MPILLAVAKVKVSLNWKTSPELADLRHVYTLMMIIEGDGDCCHFYYMRGWLIDIRGWLTFYYNTM